MQILLTVRVRRNNQVPITLLTLVIKKKSRLPEIKNYVLNLVLRDDGAGTDRYQNRVQYGIPNVLT